MLKQEMNLLHVKHILLLVLLLCLPWHGYAKKKPAAVQLTAEDQARFRYYFYEAERLYLNEQFADAALLFRFCLMLNEEDPIMSVRTAPTPRTSVFWSGWHILIRTRVTTNRHCVCATCWISVTAMT